jgi:hypothetical protein
MCTHAAWVLNFEEGGCTVCKCWKLCVSFAVLQCLARMRLGCHSSDHKNHKKADHKDHKITRIIRRQMHVYLEIHGCVGCVPQMVHLDVHNVQVGVVMKMSSICYSNVQHTSIYVYNIYPSGFGNAMPDGTTQSEQLRSAFHLRL